MNVQRKSESETLDEAKEEPPIEKIFECGSENAISLGTKKCQRPSQRYVSDTSDTIKLYENHLIMLEEVEGKYGP